MKHSKGMDLIQGHLAKTAVLDLKTCQSAELPLLQKRKPTSHCKLCLMRILFNIPLSSGITGIQFLHFVMLLYCIYVSVFLPQHKGSFTIPHCHFSTTSVSHVVCIKKITKCVMSFSLHEPQQWSWVWNWFSCPLTFF